MAGEIHRARVNAVTAAVLALVKGGQVGVAALGRAIARTTHKHGIKRADRLIGNQHLLDELETFYAAIARFALRGVMRPVILLDWTEAGKGMCTLAAAVPVRGRAITILAMTVPQTQYTAPAVEKLFVQKLAALLAPKCVPILVADAGFRAPWMRMVRAAGWDFVTRVRGKTLVQRVGEEHWQHWKELLPSRSRKPRTLGTYRIVRACCVEAQLVVVDARSPRSRKTEPRRRNLRALRATRAHREPWFLATSLQSTPKLVVELYAARMQIELTFRDLKSHRFGWGFEDARSHSIARAAVQIMLAALASLVCMTIGLAAEAAGLHLRYQANTTRKRRVLSLVTLGRAVIRDLLQTRRSPALESSNSVEIMGIP